MSNILDFDSRIPARRKVAEALIKFVLGRPREEAIREICKALEGTERAGMSAGLERAALMAATLTKHLTDLSEEEDNP
jgi:hypothetical protein